MKKSKQIAFSGMMTALSVVLLFFGSVTGVLTYVMPLLSSVIMLVLKYSVNEKSAWLTFVTVSIITALLLPDKETALTYAFFFGYYPIIKDALDKIKFRFAGAFLKILIFNAGIISSQLILIYVFGIPYESIFKNLIAEVAVLLLLANLIFYVYERLLTVLKILYCKKYKNRIDRMLK